jgi:hypothetical protein
VNAQNASNKILVDLHAESQRDLLSSAGTAPSRIVPLHCDNGINEAFLPPLRTRAIPAPGCIQQAVLSFPPHVVELEQSGRLHNNSGTENAGGHMTVRPHEKSAQAGEDTIRGMQIGRTLSATIEDQLMPDQPNRQFVMDRSPIFKREASIRIG